MSQRRTETPSGASLQARRTLPVSPTPQFRHSWKKMHSAASLPGIMSQRRGFSERMRDLITEPISDAGLLERFASHRDEAAFGELVKRHGPQVLKVCRRGLPSEHDVEDVFQATFFVLAHKAAAVSWNESVESWLCAVARRLVLHARASAWQRQSRERPITALGGARAEEYSGFLPDQDHPLYDPHEEMERRDIRRVLHAALGQLLSRRLQRALTAQAEAGPMRFVDRTLRSLCDIRVRQSRAARPAKSACDRFRASGHAVAPLSLGGSDEPGIAAPAITWGWPGFPRTRTGRGSRS